MANRTHPTKGKKNQPPHNQNLIQEIKNEIELNQDEEPTLAELASIEEEIGLLEIPVDPEQLTDQFNQASAILTGGDIDASFEQANAVGDEAVGGTVATPNQDIVEEIAAAVGLEMRDRSSLRTTEFLEKRDDQRWELDPTSSEDYEERENESF